jgi:hypothetical protein
VGRVTPRAPVLPDATNNLKRNFADQRGHVLRPILDQPPSGFSTKLVIYCTKIGLQKTRQSNEEGRKTGTVGARAVAGARSAGRDGQLWDYDFDPFFSLSSPKGGEGRGEEANGGRPQGPLTPTLSPFGRGEGVPAAAVSILLRLVGDPAALRANEAAAGRDGKLTWTKEAAANIFGTETMVRIQ